MAICVELQYAEGVGWFLGSQGAEAPQDYHCQYVLQTQAEFVAADPSGPSFTAEEIAVLKNQAANPSVLNLSPAEGAQVGGAIVLTWAVAWVFKALVRSLNVDGDFEK